MWRCCSRTDTHMYKCIGICPRKPSSVVHFTAATDRRFHCDVVLVKNLYLTESFSGLYEPVRVTVDTVLFLDLGRMV